MKDFDVVGDDCEEACGGFDVVGDDCDEACGGFDVVGDDCDEACGGSKVSLMIRLGGHILLALACAGLSVDFFTSRRVGITIVVGSGRAGRSGSSTSSSRGT